MAFNSVNYNGREGKTESSLPLHRSKFGGAFPSLARPCLAAAKLPAQKIMFSGLHLNNEQKLSCLSLVKPSSSQQKVTFKDKFSSLIKNFKSWSLKNGI